MPTTYRPELVHKHFRFAAAADEIGRRLDTSRAEILLVIGFYDEYGNPNEWTEDERKRIERESGEIMKEIVGALAWSAAIMIDAGFKPANRVRATVLAIARTPDLLISKRETIEPEALGAIASRYQSKAEPPGTRWFDVTGDGGRKPTRKELRSAAEAAAEELSRQARKGGRRDVGLDKLAKGLGGVFGRFQDGPIKRAVAVETNRAGRAAGMEYGRFKSFLDLVLPALDAVLAQYPGARKISRDSLVRRTISWQSERSTSPRGLNGWKF